MPSKPKYNPGKRSLKKQAWCEDEPYYEEEWSYGDWYRYMDDFYPQTSYSSYEPSKYRNAPLSKTSTHTNNRIVNVEEPIGRKTSDRRQEKYSKHD